jgi:hypothetical protein
MGRVALPAALKFMGAVVAVSSVADWLALLAAISAIAAETYRIMSCALSKLPCALLTPRFRQGAV